jgi:aryl-alcohol dehydrogenase-like predicted oxidoreductase
MTASQSPAELVLGTAQLANPQAEAAASQARAVLKAALGAGIRWFETAPGHHGSETLVGQAFRGDRRARIIARLGSAATRAATRSTIEADIASTTSRLGLSCIDVLTLDSPDAISADGGRLWRILGALRNEGRIYDLAVEVASPEEALRAIAEPDVTGLQLKFNALDWRWREAGVIDALKARPDIRVHAHSALLHGMLAGTPGTKWPTLGAIDADALRLTLWTMARDMGRDCPADLCIAYVRAQPWIHGVIVGAATQAQLALNIARFRRPALTKDEVARVNALMPRPAADLLKRPPYASHAA